MLIKNLEEYLAKFLDNAKGRGSLILDIKIQLFNFLVFTVTGIIIGILFDFFRIIRRSFKTPDFITYIEDIIFWLSAGSILLFNIFVFNNGKLRLYLFIALAFGIFIYMLSFSKHVIKTSVSILVFIKKIIYVPIKTVINFVRKHVLEPFLLNFKKIRHNLTTLIKKQHKKTAKASFPNIYDKIDK